MYKVTPNPPETSGSKSEKNKLQDAAQRAIDHYLKPAETKASTNEKTTSVCSPYQPTLKRKHC